MKAGPVQVPNPSVAKLAAHQPEAGRLADLSFHAPTLLRSVLSFRKLCLLLTLVVLSVAVRSASASQPLALKKKHPRLHALAHVFANVSLPGVGLLPEDEEELPVDGLKYELKLVRNGTGEALNVVYRVGDTYIPEALDQLNTFLRDSHNEEVSIYDPRTFDVLHTMLAKLGKSGSAIDILSGYRSQETNDMLRASGTTNAAEHSQHIVAKAVDLRVPGVSATLLRDAAKSLDAGGVGYYPSSQFVHVDVGPVRQWTYTPHRTHAHSRHSKHS
jgi:uncharacterized protein YcbK (DUF882 family)